VEIKEYNSKKLLFFNRQPVEFDQKRKTSLFLNMRFIYFLQTYFAYISIKKEGTSVPKVKDHRTYKNITK
jgi:hypothetical protein